MTDDGFVTRPSAGLGRFHLADGPTFSVLKLERTRKVGCVLETVSAAEHDGSIGAGGGQ